MPKREEQHTGTFGEYIQSIRDFQTDFGKYEEDVEFAKNGGTIYYFFDANIIALFLNPFSAASSLAILPAEFFPYLRLASCIAAQTLFGLGLPGQRSHPPAITSSHILDIMGMTDAIQKKLRSLDTTQGFEIRKEVIDAYHRLRDNPNPKDAKFLFRKLNALESVELREALRLTKLFSEELVIGAEQHPAISTLLVHPENSYVAHWARDINAEKNISNNDEKNVTLLHRDATSIAQIQSLNDAEANKSRKFLFVTRDEALHAAYANWYQKPENHERNCIYICRHPRQYVPLANFELANETVSGNSLGSRIAIHTGKTLENLLSGFAESNDERELIDYGTSDKLQLRLERNVIQAKHRWRMVRRDSIIAQMDLLILYLKTEIDGLTGSMRMESLRESYELMIDDALRKVDNVHLALGAQGALLRYLVDYRTQAGGSTAAMESRAPLIIQLDALINYIGLNDINEFLKRLVHPENVAEVHTLRDRLTWQNMGEGFLAGLFAACVSLRVGQWKSARNFAEGALSVIHPVSRGGAQSARLVPTRTQEDAQYELLYVRCLASRFLLTNLADYDETAETLLQCGIHHQQSRDSLKYCRAEFERAALSLTVLLQSKFVWNQASKIAPPREAEILATVESCLTHAYIALNDISHDTASSLMHTIEQWVLNERVELAIYYRFFASKPRRQDTKSLEDLYQEMSAAIKRAATKELFPELNLHILRWMIASKPDARRAAASEVCALLKMRLDSPANLQPIDHKELQWILDEIERSL